ncbi:PucR family transcriptional regulator [Bacillus massiliglaciei]|uniref:PucR family transcriptional regulator n=1 Tax=Bacillus massiliglaciei TaxID=1816693 RepID=UPI000DA63240|nr:helix-turn-helix domain-containing protein [Bacillus massiliglaciei]
MLLDKIVTLTDINDIAEDLSTYLKKPIIIENEQFSLLAYSSYSIDHFDQVNKQTIITKRWPISILEKFMDEGIVDQLRNTPHPFRVRQMKEIDLNQRVVVSMVYKDQILGYIWVQETDPMSDEELELLHQASFHIGKLLHQKNQEKQQNHLKRNKLYNKIIHDNNLNEDKIKWEAADLNIVIPGTFLLHVFSIAEPDGELFSEALETIQLFANALPHLTHVFTDQNHILILHGSRVHSSDSLTSGALELTETVLNQFYPHKMYAGIGNEYSSILQMRRSYIEAMEVIKAAAFIGTSEHLPYEFNKLGIFRYLEPIWEYQKKTDYQNENLASLQQKDEESQTKLIQTLEIYLLNNCKIKPTAEKLYIHPNTLKYRLNQIAELTSIDFTDFHSRMQLYIEIQLLKKRH